MRNPVMWIAVMYELASLLHSCLCRHIAYGGSSNTHTHTHLNKLHSTENDNGNNNEALRCTQKTGNKRTTEATKRTKYHWAKGMGYAIIWKLYSILQSHSAKCDRKERQHLTMLSRTRQILLPHKEKSGRQIVIFFTSVGCTSRSPKL